MTVSKYEALSAMREKGFIFDSAKDFITEESMTRLANDAMITGANSGVPAVFTSYVDPQVVYILTAPTNAREIFGETKKGDWATTSAIFKAVESVGKTETYTDYGNAGMADVNVVYPERDNYVFQTTVRYGEREMATLGKAALNLAAEKQRSAATIINIDSNKFYLNGVAGKRIYGLLNDPNLPADISPATVRTNVVLWSAKTTVEIYDDCIAIFAELAKNSQGRISVTSDLVLAAPPAIMVLLGKTTEFGVSVLDMLKKYFTNIKFVILPELYANSTNTVLMAARTVDGYPVAQLAFSEKMRAHQLIPEGSSYRQKYSAGTYGAVVLRPFAIQMMSGV